MTRERRKELIRKIEEKRGSKVITYVTSDRPGLQVQIMPDVVSILHQHILALGNDERKKLDLFIYSRGGQSDVPWTIVSMFREYCEKGSFSVLIPYRAHSAATVIAVGADEIVMSKKGELGPIDITLTNGPYNPTEKNSNQRLPIPVEDVMGYFSLLDKIDCKRPDEKMKGFELLTNSVHPLALGQVNRLLDETKLVAYRLLSTRAEPFNESDNHEIIKKLSSEAYSHNHAISRTEATKYIGLKQVKSAEDVEISEELWKLYEEYCELFRLEEPFNPEEYLFKNNLEIYDWTDLNLACIESLKTFHICMKSHRVKRLRQIPPQLTLNLGTVNIPAINIPTLPAGVTQEQINILINQIMQSIMQQSVNNALQVAVQQLLNSLPVQGYEHVDYDGGWRRSD
jgi:hypothetical protein